MTDWVHDREPTQTELRDNDLTFATINKVTLDGEKKIVVRMSGLHIKAYFGEEWRYGETILAWMPIPKPWDEQQEAEEAAAVVAAMRHDDMARELIQKENGDAASRS